MSILAVPDHFYYSSLKSLQSASKLSGNEIPVLKALVQIEGHQTHWQGAISSAIWRCHRLLTCSWKVFSSVFVAIRYHHLVLCSLFPFWGFLLSGSHPSHQACVFQIVFKVAELTDAALPGSCSIPNWILKSFFFFLLGISVLHYFFLLNSSKFRRVAWFHSQTFCFQETEPWSEVQQDQVTSPTPPNKAPEGVKKEIPGRVRTRCHRSQRSPFTSALV